MMRIPKMILFDYGETLIHEEPFDGVKGTAALLKHATQNKYHLSAARIQEEASKLNHELGRWDVNGEHKLGFEIPHYAFSAYLYESLGIRFDLPPSRLEEIFWDNASPAVPMPGISDLLADLREKNIRTGVISNISYSHDSLYRRIRRLLPEHDFEFIIASSEYVFRKPNVRIFRLALEKASLSADEVWFAGDRYGADIVGARNAGLTPVWYTREKTDSPGVIRIGDWADLRILLGTLES